VFAWGESDALKLFHERFSRDAVQREFDATIEAYRQGLPVPMPRRVIEIDGRYGIVFQRIEGVSMLVRLNQRPWMFAANARMLASLHLRIHQTRSDSLPSQREQLVRRIQDASPLAETTRQRIIEMLDTLPDSNAVCHGDYHPDNVMLTPTGPVVLDWPLGCRGNPLADVARTSLMLTRAAVPEFTAGKYLIRLMRHHFDKSYVRRYLSESGQTLEDLDPWLLPVAAARLSEGIEDETPTLLRFITRVLNS
jgi:aminoglycoside phosphotransferase (APT) family kinase protein